jgi:hypothetical protein
MSFEWLERTPMRTHGMKLRVQVATAELVDRAGTLFRLGFTQAQATTRLVARVAWEYDPRPEALSDAAIGKIVADTYARRPGGE